MPQSSLSYRSGTGVWFTGVVAALGLFFTVDAAVRGYAAVAVLTALWFAVAVWLFVVFTVLPRLEADGDGMRIENAFTSARMPWGAVASISARLQLVVTTTGGERFTAHGVPRPGVRARAKGQHDAHRELELLRSESSAGAASGPVERGVRTVRVIVLAVLVVVAVVATILLVPAL